MGSHLLPNKHDEALKAMRDKMKAASDQPTLKMPRSC
jgi:hypothetical protein